jgi:hypothetical protein
MFIYISKPKCWARAPKLSSYQASPVVPAPPLGAARAARCPTVRCLHSADGMDAMYLERLEPETSTLKQSNAKFKLDVIVSWKSDRSRIQVVTIATGHWYCYDKPEQK